MRSDEPVRADVLAVAVALCGNREAFKRATRLIEHEAHIQTDPTEKIAAWSVAIVRELLKQQKQL